MKRHLIYRYLMLTVGLSLMLSTSGLSIDAHFCTGKLKRINVFGHAKTCQEVMLLKKACCSSKSTVLKEMSCANGTHENGCCSNEQIKLNLETDYNFNAGEEIALTIPSIVLHQHYIYKSSTLLAENDSKIITDQFKPPPDRVPFHIRFQKFLC